MYNTDSQTVPADTLCESSSQVKIQLSRSASRALTTAKEILETHKDKLIAVAEKLLEVETISNEEFEAIFPPPVDKNQGIPVIQPE